MEANNLKDAKALLEKSLTINKAMLGEDHISNTGIYSLMAQVLMKMEKYDEALNNLTKVFLNVGLGNSRGQIRAKI